MLPVERIILDGLIRAGGSLPLPVADEGTDIETIKLLTMLTAMAIDGAVEIAQGDAVNTYTITDAGRALLDIRPQ
ncbi:hypothetical protein N2603_23345 [Bradyrhizobium huanghuaihaiense]|uniref:hypothetical protein n=1 Tax=Bradyrhizobium huanghuaihaiense TaxID=990078 RepID=UPI0021AA3162|nr:hypothetical protein [Bradyrhizobium sp. CB3035]UWU73042.1 hypothetical protein N2603_23345 [Bradyrhizobium sp. CB3035]